MNYKVSTENHTYDIEITEGDQAFQVKVGSENPTVYSVDFKDAGSGSVYSMLANNDSYRVIINKSRDTCSVYTRGYRFRFNVEDERTFLMRSLIGAGKSKTTGEVKAPIPGLVSKVLVVEGDVIEAGRGIVILEAMKMENEMKSPFGGSVRRLMVKPGQNVEKGQVLFIVE
jgi:biotin carboxyl carrier protein